MAKIPKFLQTYLASYDLSQLDVETDKKLIITEILNKGDSKALEWLAKTYTKKDVEEVVSSPTGGMWLETNLSYWQKVLGIRISQEMYQKAIINLNPL